jgi:DHA1 family tetracycline resistance protein-like MFS transporter
LTAESSHPGAGKHTENFILLTVFLDMVGLGLIWPILPRMIEQVGHTDLAGAALIGGWLYFVYAAMQFLLGPTIGNLSDAFGRRPVLLISVAGLGIDFLLTGFAPNLWWLFLGRLIAGICGASYTTANACLTDITAPDQRAKAFGRIGAAFGLGFIVGPGIGGLLGELGVRVPFFAAGAVSILNVLYGYFVLPETLVPENRRPFSLKRSNPIGALKVFSSYHQMMPLLAIIVLFDFASSVYPAIWTFWGIAKLNWSEMTNGLTLALFGLTTAVVQGFGTGPVVARLGERGAALLGLGTSVVVCLAYGFASSTALVLLLVILHSPEGLAHPALVATMSRDVPDNAQGELQGGISGAQNLAMLVGTLFFSQLFGLFIGPHSPWPSPSIAFGVAAALLLACLVLLLRLKRTG